eukprot:scaffold234734_cov18-Tisochrysis_lutea.AAC.1
MGVLANACTYDLLQDLRKKLEDTCVLAMILNKVSRETRCATHIYQRLTIESICKAVADT